MEIQQVVSELEGRNLHREIVHQIHDLVRKLQMLKSEISEQVEGESSAAAETSEAIRRDVTQKASAPTIVEDAAAARNKYRAVGDASGDAGRVVEHSHSSRTVANEGQSEKIAVDTVSNSVVEETDGTTDVVPIPVQDTRAEDAEDEDAAGQAAPRSTTYDRDTDQPEAISDVVAGDIPIHSEKTAEASDGNMIGGTNDVTNPDESSTKMAIDRRSSRLSRPAQSSRICPIENQALEDPNEGITASEAQAASSAISAVMLLSSKTSQTGDRIMRNGRRPKGKKRHPVSSPSGANKRKKKRAKTPKIHKPDLSFLSNRKLIPRGVVQNASQQIASRFSTCDEKTLSLLGRMFFGIASPEACAQFQTACKVVHERRDVSWPVNLASVGVSVRALGTLGNYNNIGSILERYHMLQIVRYFDERQKYHRDQMPPKRRMRELRYGHTKQRAVKENEGSKRAVSLALDDLLEVYPDLSCVPPGGLRRAPQRTDLLNQCNAGANWLLMEKAFTFGSLALVPTGGSFAMCNQEYVHASLSSRPADTRPGCTMYRARSSRNSWLC